MPPPPTKTNNGLVHHPQNYSPQKKMPYVLLSSSLHKQADPSSYLHIFPLYPPVKLTWLAMENHHFFHRRLSINSSWVHGFQPAMFLGSWSRYVFYKPSHHPQGHPHLTWLVTPMDPHCSRTYILCITFFHHPMILWQVNKHPRREMGGGNGIFILGERWIQLMVFLVVWIPGIPRKWKGWKGLGFDSGVPDSNHKPTNLPLVDGCGSKNNMKKRPDGH